MLPDRLSGMCIGLGLLRGANIRMYLVFMTNVRHCVDRIKNMTIDCSLGPHSLICRLLYIHQVNIIFTV
jgi:hypothetical protein